MSSRLGQDPGAAGLAQFDLNGDGRLDVTDLSYINHNRNITGGPQVLDTAAIVSPELDTSAVTVTGGSAQQKTGTW